MNALTKAEPGISAETMEMVLGAGNLAQLSSQQRVEYLTSVCRSLGLNPLTRPIRLITFNGQTVPYATRDCADQLRKLYGISLQIKHQRVEDDLFVVTVHATDKAGRHDEDMGVVPLGSLKGEARANALLKGVTKAKRRVTLSICGLGFLDESEVESLPGAQAIEEQAPAAPAIEHAQTANTAPMARAINDEIPALNDGEALGMPPPRRTRTWTDVLREIKAMADRVQDDDALRELAHHPDVIGVRQSDAKKAKDVLADIIEATRRRLHPELDW